MFQVHLKLAFLIEGCPPSGLEAVDFRGDNHLERDAHNLFLVRYRNLDHEALCRTYAEFLNADADLIIRMVGGLEEILIPSALNGLIHPETGSVIDWSRCLIDSSSVRAVFGGHTPAATRQTVENTVSNTTSSPMVGGRRWPPK